MVKSPWSITGRQKRCTSRVQAFCSSGVPLRACADAPLDMESDNRLIDRTSLSIVFLTLHFLTEGNSTGKCDVLPTWMIRVATIADDRTSGSTSAGKCGQIYVASATTRSRFG